ncbi:MAG: DUF4421 family protein [Bacteroidia bacterium]|nr:DUF4421 family protein [Bacteroidia bacterium]
MRFIFLLLVPVLHSFAQTAENRWDTLKYQKFHSNLIVGVFQSYVNFVNQIECKGVQDTTGRIHTNYNAQSKLITGVEIYFDKLSIDIFLKSKLQESDGTRGNTRAFSFNFNYGDNKWYVENSFRYFKGFYDANTSSYDTSFKRTYSYYRQPDLTNVLLKSKLLFFTNHKKYAFRGAYAGNYRQIRSAATWIFGGNINFNSLRADSAFLPYQVRTLYGDYGTLKGFKVLGFSAHVGGAFTLVIFKGFFINMMLTTGPEQQWRTYSYADNSKLLSYISFSTDFRTSIGFNLKRCYFISYSLTDFAFYNNVAFNLHSQAISGGLAFGWRFNTQTPQFYKRFQKTKLYSLI